MTKYAGSEWIVEALRIRDMSELGVAVADLLGEVYLGIYHMEGHRLCKVNWCDPERIEVNIYGELCTIDFDHLTRLVVVAHDRMVRVAIKGIAPNYLRMIFTQRAREGQFWERCPTLEDHAKALRAHYAEPER